MPVDKVTIMPDVPSHVETAGAIMAGASVSALLVTGNWSDKIIAFIVGGFTAAVAGPIFAPLMLKGLSEIYGWAGVDPGLIPINSVGPFTGFTIGFFGLDIALWIKDRVKAIGASIKIPGLKGSD